MPELKAASPQISVRLYKAIERRTIDGMVAISARFQGSEDFIDLTPYLNDGSRVHTSKSVREPAGAFSITFADKPNNSVLGAISSFSHTAIESLYGLIEPMDIVEIRMWNGLGPRPAVLPIIMRGFVSEVQRQQTMTQDGRPQRQVVVLGQDYGKIWQMYQVLYLAAYAAGVPMLTNFGLFDLFGISVTNAMPARQFVIEVTEKILNPFLREFMPPYAQVPKEIIAGDGITVKYGRLNISHYNSQGSIYDIVKFHTDTGVWNELYTEDREDGVHMVYRPIPALHLNTPGGPASTRKIQEDAPDPIYCEIPDSDVKSISVSRSDSNVANFYWVNNSKFDIVDDLYRKLASIPQSDQRVFLQEYPNTAVKYYGIRPMQAETQLGDTEIAHMASGLDENGKEQRSVKMEAWIDRRRRQMMEMNRDNVVFEHGSALVKGGPMRPGGQEVMRAGDYARFQMGRMTWDAYVYQIDHEFLPFVSYQTTLHFDRGEGFAVRAMMEGGIQSPWLAEQARRTGGGL